MMYQWWCNRVCEYPILYLCYYSVIFLSGGKIVCRWVFSPCDIRFIPFQDLLISLLKCSVKFTRQPIPRFWFYLTKYRKHSHCNKTQNHHCPPANGVAPFWAILHPKTVLHPKGKLKWLNCPTLTGWLSFLFAGGEKSIFISVDTPFRIIWNNVAYNKL